MSGAQVLSCEEALRVLTAYLDGELEAGGASDREIEDHLTRCRSCYSRADFERRLKERLAGLGETEVRREFAERMQRLMNAFPGSTPDS